MILHTIMLKCKELNRQEQMMLATCVARLQHIAGVEALHCQELTHSTFSHSIEIVWKDAEAMESEKDSVYDELAPFVSIKCSKPFLTFDTVLQDNDLHANRVLSVPGSKYHAHRVSGLY